MIPHILFRACSRGRCAPVLLVLVLVLVLSVATTIEASRLSAQSPAPTSIAITGGTVFPVSGPRIEGGTVVITGGRISAVGAGVAIPAGATRIDATGKWVTPGLVNALTTLGLNEAGGPSFSGGYDDTRAKAADGISANFDAVDGINPASTFLRPAVQDGITSAGVWPSGNWFAGRGAVIDLTGTTMQQLLVRRSVGMLVNFQTEAAGSGARGAMLARLRELFNDVRLFSTRRVDYDGARMRALSAPRAQLEALLPVLRGTLPLVVETDRASDIRAALGFAREFGLKLILVGGAEAWQVAAELASAKVPVMVGALNNIPQSFDALGARQENAALLRAAGVSVSLIGNGPGDPRSFNVRNIRQEAGNAVAYGMTWDDALRAITLAPAEALGVADAVGALTVGRQANVVVWDGDPFEFSTTATQVYIRGVLQRGPSRQDELTARYRTPGAR